MTGTAKSFNMTRYNARRVRNRLVLGLAVGATGLGLVILAAILLDLLWEGGSAWNVTLFTHTMPTGLWNAIVGSVLITVVGALLGTPVGIFAGTYLAEYSRGGRFAQIVQFINDVLLSAPSIIIGLFVAQMMVVQSRHFSGWAGSVALAIIVVPIVVRTTVDMLALVPNGLREAAAALGAPKWKIITLVCYRAAAQGMLTGIMLAVARIAGETAPLLFTAFGDDHLSWNMNGPISALPLAINNFVNDGTPDAIRLAWGGALLITVVILTLNITARYLSNLGSVKQ